MFGGRALWGCSTLEDIIGVNPVETIQRKTLTLECSSKDQI